MHDAAAGTTERWPGWSPVAARATLRTTAELRADGVGSSTLSRALAAGQIARCHRGVYRTQEAPSTEGAALQRSLAALLVAREPAQLSHGAALWAHGVAPAPLVVDVRVPLGRARAGGENGLRRHRTRRLEPTIRIDGVPVTSLDRALVDLAAVARPAEVVVALARADGLGILDPGRLRGRDRTGTTGAAALALALEVLTRCGGVVRSLLEAELLVLCHVFGLGVPIANLHLRTDLGLLEADAVFRDARLIVESDGRETHAAPAAFERDRSRWASMVAAGWRVLVVTWAEVLGRPERVAARIAAALAHRPPRRRGRPAQADARRGAPALRR